MTCIVGIVEDGKVYIGGDSAGVAGLDITKRKDKKVFKIGTKTSDGNNEMIMGFTSSFRMGQLLNYNLKIPKKPSEDDDMQYMVTTVIYYVRKCLKDGGYATVADNVEKGGAFLVGFNGRLFNVESDFQVGESYDDYMATGCGESFALGSLFATKDSKMAPEDRIKLALSAAAHHSAGVCEPFFVETL